MPDAAHKLDLELATQSAGKENWNNFYLAAANIKAEALKKKRAMLMIQFGFRATAKVTQNIFHSIWGGRYCILHTTDLFSSQDSFFLVSVE